MLPQPAVSGQPARTNLLAGIHATGENEDVGVGIISLLHQKHTFRALQEGTEQADDTGTVIVGLPALAGHTPVAPGTMVAVIAVASIEAAPGTMVVAIALGPTEAALGTMVAAIALVVESPGA